ncbi:MAG TPA: SRPBCC domain-containing protein [Methanotrichaceae archaeon]|nr:SRPBCC domain-containing protein [Methanotrichaceae archaeon]
MPRRSITHRAIHTEVIINASPSRVWQTLMDFGSYPQWNPFILQVTGSARQGEKLKVQMHAGSRTMTLHPTVLAVQPERELLWLGSLFIPGIFDGEHSFIIEPLGKDRVRMVQSETFNGLLIPFSGSLLNETERSFRAMNQALKKRAEQTS